MRPIHLVLTVVAALSGGACTRPTSHGSRISVSIDGPIRLSAPPYYDQLKGTTSFGSLAVESASEIDCIGVMVTANGPAETCETLDEEILAFTHAAGFVSAAQSLTLEVSPGAGRVIRVIGIKNLSGGACPNIKSFDRLMISRPRVIATVTRDLSAGEIPITVTPNFSGAEIASCDSETVQAYSTQCDKVAGIDQATIPSDQIIAHLAEGYDELDVDEEFGTLGMTALGDWSALNSFHYQLPAGLTPYVAAQTLCASPTVQFVEAPDLALPVRYYDGVLDQSASVTGAGLVAIVGTGIDTGHSVLSDYSNSLWLNLGEDGSDGDGNGFASDYNGWNFYDDTADVLDLEGEGTTIAGAVFKQAFDITGTGGSSPISVMPVKVFGGAGPISDSTRIASGILYATDMNADVIVLGFAGTMTSELVRRAMIYSNNRGALLIAPAGNSTTNNDTDPVYPANFDIPNVLAVAAHNSANSPATFSNYGARTVDIAGSGVSVFTMNLAGFTSVSGTTLAAGLVAGAAAVAKNNLLSMSGFQLRQAVLSSATAVNAWTGLSVSGGILNADGVQTEVTNSYLIPSVPYEQPTQ